MSSGMRTTIRLKRKDIQKMIPTGMSEWLHIKAAARDATAVSTVCDRRMFCNFAGRQQLVEWAPVSRMPFGCLKQ